MELRRIAGFFARVLLVYAVLMAPWPGLREGYTSLFRWGCGALHGEVGSEGYAALQPLGDDGLTDATFLLVKKRSRTVVRNGLQSRYIGYLPAVIVVALVLGTPCGWRRRAIGLPVALVLIHAFVAVRVTLAVYADFATVEGIALVELGPLSQKAVRAATEILSDPITSVVAAILVWTLVMFRRGDWAEIAGPEREADGAG